jgi:uncharacterized protein (DUF2336 family)
MKVSEKATFASLQGRAKELLALAPDPSDSARSALASGLYDLARASADLSPDERNMAVNVVMEIIKRAPAGVRQQLSERLARDPQAPKVLVLALAHDQIAIAFPVLSESSVLDEADLLEIIRQSPLEHRLGTLQRESVPASVSSAIVETRDAMSMRWLVENPGANIPRDAMEVLVEASRAEPELQKPLVGRSDLPKDLASKMQEFVSEDLRQQLVDQHHAAASPGGKNAAGAAPGGQSADWALSLALEMRAAGALTAEFLVKTLREGKLALFDELFARYSRISSAAARQILSSPTGESLAIALKAQGVDKSTFATLFLLSRKARDPASMSSATLARATESFEKLKVDEAKKRFAALQAAYPEDPPPT